MRSLVVSGHDFRSPRKANMHFITAELAKRGPTRMFSVGLSHLSALRGRDPKLGMTNQPNIVEVSNGVDCFLWKSFVHPFNSRRIFPSMITDWLFELYAASVPELLYEWAAESDLIVLESGLPILWIERLRAEARNAKILYNASDDLVTIGCASTLVGMLERFGNLLDAVRVPSPKMLHLVPNCRNVFFVPHGIDPSFISHSQESPFESGLNAVSIGSMLFDPNFFNIACSEFPQVKFHVIGSGYPRRVLPDVVNYYPEMKFSDTVNFLANAEFSVAAYRNAAAPYYLSDTSMKLIQADYLGVPSVCPHFAKTEDQMARFSFQPGDRSSIVSAITQALQQRRYPPSGRLNWNEVTELILKSVAV